MDSLYQISDRYKNLMSLLDCEDVPQEEINRALWIVEDEMSVKGGNILWYLGKIDMYLEAAKAQKKKLDAYIKGMENRKKRIITASLDAMHNADVNEILTDRGRLKIKRNPPAVVIDDENQIRSEYFRQTVSIVVDKTKIKEALKAGKTVVGAHLEQGESLMY